MPFDLARDLASCGGWGLLLFSGLLLAGGLSLARTAFRPGRRTSIAARVLAGIVLFFGLTWSAGAVSGALDPAGAGGCRAGAAGLDSMLLLVFGLVSFGALVIYADGRFGTWHRLVEHYPASGPAQGQRFDLESVYLSRFQQYSNCMEVIVGGKGISMRRQGPFRLGHPPVAIPWTAVVGTSGAPAGRVGRSCG